MKFSARLYALALLFGTLCAGNAMALDCGMNTGQPAMGKPIMIGGIFGDAPPGNWSASTQAAAAYFACVNANGGINGRPVKYIAENDQWNPEAAVQAAAKLVNDDKVVAMVASGSFIEMAVNGKAYQQAGIMSMASACAISECFDNPNIVSTNQGPLPSILGAVMYAREELGAKNIACIATAIPNSGNWSCDEAIRYIESYGGKGTMIPVSPISPDFSSAVLEAMATGADTMVLNMPGSLAVPVLAAAKDQDIRDQYKWVSSTPLYDLSIPAAIGEYWAGHIFVNAELTPLSENGPDAQNWIAVLDKFGRPEDKRDTFSQAGYLSARFFVKAALEMKPQDLDDRAKVTSAIKAIKGYRSDLMCGPYYVGDANFHMPNHAGYMVKIVKDGFEVVRGCYEYDSKYFDPMRKIETEMGLR